MNDTSDYFPIEDPTFTSSGDKATTNYDSADREKLWSDDCLSRREFADGLIRFASAQIESLVIALDGKWGCGKTFLLEHVVKELNLADQAAESAIAVYLNAWEHDYLDNPLLYVFNTIVDELERRNLIANNIKLEIVGAIAKLAMSAGDVITNGRVSGALKLIRELANNVADINDRITALNDADGEELLSLFKDQTKATTVLKSHLTQIAKDIKTRTGNPLIMCIDELDRCRPTYAIEMLERIKHCFMVPNVVFILGIDLEELAKSIKAVYGDVDAGNYLRRFINATVPLPPESSNKFVQVLFDKFKINTRIATNLYKLGRTIETSNKSHLAWAIGKVFELLSQSANLRLREIQDALCRYFNIGISAPLPNITDYIVLVIVSILKVKDPNLLGKYVRGDINSSEIPLYFFKSKSIPFTSNDVSSEYAIEAIVKTSLATTREQLAQIANSDLSQSFHSTSSLNLASPFPSQTALGNVLMAALQNDMEVAINGSKKDIRAKIPSRVAVMADRINLRFRNESGWK